MKDLEGIFGNLVGICLSCAKMPNNCTPGANKEYTGDPGGPGTGFLFLGLLFTS